MKHKTLFSTIAWVALAATSTAQPSDVLSLVRQAQERSSKVRAAQASVEARKATLSGVRSLTSPTLELSPGVGLTNGTTFLSQEIDISGRRSASMRVASASLESAEIELDEAKSAVTMELLTSLARLLAAGEEVESARLALESAKSLLAAVAKQNEIGEAPTVHVTRAEIDVFRATQLLAVAQGRHASAMAAVESLVGAQEGLLAVKWPEAPQTSLAARSFDILKARAHQTQAEAQSRLTRATFAPSLSAGLATDAWSLDRNAFRSENLGFQVSLRMPLFDSGQKRGAVQASDLEIKVAQANIEEAQRIADLRLTEATNAYKTATSVATTYEGDVLPKAESMLTAMRQGYTIGLVTLVEVLEAQTTLVRLRQERIQAVLNVRLSQLDLWNAQLALPGTEVSR